ncbi:DNA-binding protein [Streptomyces sp. PRB2-1]|jgi:RNA polymerase-binding protein DksA|uniref:DNA-binding protein n=1 Tax=Actinacidiphila epipremni TaxID=2053013 RepID=A0ABX0ZLV4_9ACTN|nr:DNA-binding protein [Actinacidiphila epipremni]
MAPGKKKAVKTAAQKKSSAEQVTAGSPASEEAVTGKAAPKKTAGGKSAVAGKKSVSDGRTGREQSETGAGTVGVEKTAATEAASGVPAARGIAGAGELAVLPGEDPWSPQEAEEARSELTAEVDRLQAEIASSEAAVAGLLRDGSDSGGDEADTGAKNISREYELALAANTRETLGQAERALQRLDEGTYGLCEVCGRPIGKARMQAFPRATLCLDDKQRQERR